MAPKYKRGSAEYNRWMEGTARANSQGEPQTAEGYYNWLYNSYKHRYGDDKTARDLAQWKTDEWKRSQKGQG